ncbi:hypothetical protein HY483_01550 [Candidatus Woesearchaeota archaeon]|nr:hypothetical protein [Candidatus Woesearchaeota archaeon]
MKNIFRTLSYAAVFVFLLVLFPVFSNVASADAVSEEPISKMIAPDYYPYPTTNVFFNDVKTFYTVSLDGEGEAFVAAKFKLAILDKMDSFSFEIPGRSVRVLGVVQEYIETSQACSYYDQVSKECLYWYTKYENPKYYSADFVVDKLSESSKVSVTLPKYFPLPSNASQSSLLVLYKVENVAVESGSVFSFDFSTPKFSMDISSARVSVSVVPPFVLKGSSDASIDYRGNVGMSMLAESSKTGLMASESSDIQSFSNSIEYTYGADVYDASGLDPFESFTVQGKYAKSKWLFYKGWIGFGVLLLTSLILLLVWGVRKLINISRDSKSKGLSTTAMVLISSGISSLVVLLTTIGTYILLAYSYSWIGYQLAEMINLLALLISTIIILASLIIPPLIVGLKRGVVPAVVTVGITLGVMVLLLIVIIIISIGLNGLVGGSEYYLY